MSITLLASEGDYAVFEMQGQSASKETVPFVNKGRIEPVGDRIVVNNMSSVGITFSNVPSMVSYIDQDTNRQMCSTNRGESLFIPPMKSMSWLNAVAKFFDSLEMPEYVDAHIVTVIGMPTALELSSISESDLKVSDKPKPKNHTVIFWQHPTTFVNFSEDTRIASTIDKLTVDKIPRFTEMFHNSIDVITPICETATITTLLSQLFGSCFVETRKQRVNNAIDLPPYVTRIPEEYFPFIQYGEGMTDVMHGRNHNPRTIVFKSLSDAPWKLTFMCIFNKTLLEGTALGDVDIRKQFEANATYFVSSIRKFVEDAFDANHIYNMIKFTSERNFHHSFMTCHMKAMWMYCVDTGSATFNQARIELMDNVSENPGLPPLPPPPNKQRPPNHLVRMQSCVPR